MSEAKPGTKEFKRLRRVELPGRTVIAWDAKLQVWVASGGTLIQGVGRTPDRAYVDHVEEHLAFTGISP